jgi:hypothetical protein
VSEFKGTPGPWAVNDQRANGWMNNAMYVGSDCTGQILARVYNETNDEEANARLIAAAPELLEALQALFNAYVSVMKSEFDFPGRPWTPERDNDEDALQAIAAIAKATGES